MQRSQRPDSFVFANFATFCSNSHDSSSDENFGTRRDVMDSETPPILLPVVRDEPLQPRMTRPVRAIVFHVLRLAIFASVMLLLRNQHQNYLAFEAAKEQEPVSVEVLRKLFPAASTGGSFDPRRRTQQVVDNSGKRLGYVLQTSPASDHIIGFSGPTNLLLAFTPGDRIAGIQVLWSRDTRDHLELIERDGSFLEMWNGKSWDEAASSSHVDGVSGATLSSFAIAEAITTRLGGRPPSLKFPDGLAALDVLEFFPDLQTMQSDPVRPALFRVADSKGGLLGYVFRSSPAADNLVGYQGPTDTLVALDPQEQVIGIRIRKSFDNEPYVRYVREEDYFLSLFNKYTLTQLAELDIFEARVEGVSGATMTSMAVADAVVLAAKKAQTKVEPASANQPPPLLSRRDVTSIGVVLFGLLIGLTRLRRYRPLRLLLLIVVISVLGLLNGDMLSQAVVVGWAQSGVPWKLASGLVIVSAVAFVVPMISKQQTYCHQLCPHGAVQQLVKRRLPWQWRVPDWLRRSLSVLPYVLLGWCLLVGMLHLNFSLVDIEPFDAWVFQAAGTTTIVIAIVGLVASLFVPMAYCRYGCPTGVLLDFVRFNAQSDVWNRSDWMATALLLITLALGFAAPNGTINLAEIQEFREPVKAWVADNKTVLQWLTAVSVVLFVGSLLAVPWLVARIPADYFVSRSVGKNEFREQHPITSLVWRILKNLLGGVLLLAGIAMLVLPGQGLLTILLGIMLIEFPGKRRLEILIIRRPAINCVVSWIRRRAGRAELQFPEAASKNRS
ncbi:MAG: NosR/NirI family nitrous oxide reductase transcriptional regulator [Planctomycetaceae bacterium]|jgi:NosR/NirI family nitrous oxide reductase transcriptional regulator